MEFRSQEEEVADDMGAVTSTAPLSYASPTSCKRGSPAAEGVRYHECLRNHAAALGGYVVDGCGEFMPHSAGDPLSCAACGCHRSFHRRDPADDDRRLLLLPTSAHRAAPPPPQAPSPRAPLLLPPPHPHKQPPQHSHHLSSPYLHAPSGSGGTTTESSSEERAHGQLSPTPLPRKRFRTRFTPEQKERMLGFAERVGWRIQRQDEALVEHFCTQVGVRRQVLKVWMHNNKHDTRRQQQE